MCHCIFSFIRFSIAYESWPEQRAIERTKQVFLSAPRSCSYEEYVGGVYYDSTGLSILLRVPRLSLRKVEPITGTVQVSRYDDMIVGLQIGINDQPTTYELQIGYLLIEGNLDPGAPTFAVRDRFPVLMHALSWSDVAVCFTGAVPESLIFIGYNILDPTVRDKFRVTDHILPLKYSNLLIFSGQMCRVRKEEVPGTTALVPDREVVVAERQQRVKQRQDIFIDELIKVACHPNRIEQI
jgi:hypothetical protein